MVATKSLLNDADVNRIFRNIGRKGIRMPRPSNVEVIPDENYDGGPIYQLLVEFPKYVPAPAAAWKIMNPFLSEAWSLVREPSVSTVP